MELFGEPHGTVLQIETIKGNDQVPKSPAPTLPKELGTRRPTKIEYKFRSFVQRCILDDAISVCLPAESSKVRVTGIVTRGLFPSDL